MWSDPVMPVLHFSKEMNQYVEMNLLEGMNSSKIYLIHYKNFCKCHNVPPLSTTIKENPKNEMIFAFLCSLQHDSQ
jgi:hypothetical protein